MIARKTKPKFHTCYCCPVCLADDACGATQSIHNEHTQCGSKEGHALLSKYKNEF